MRIIFTKPVHPDPQAAPPAEHKVTRLIAIRSKGVILEGERTSSAGGGFVVLGEFVGSSVRVEVSTNGRPQPVIYTEFHVLRDK